MFCDEAGKDTDRYLAVGGLVVEHTQIKNIRNEFNHRKNLLNIPSEAKWQSTRKGTLEKYRTLVDWAFSLIEKRELLFHCLLVDFHRFDHKLRNGGNASESLKRMYYQLILHRLLKKHGVDYDLYALIDGSKELKDLPKMKAAMNSSANEKYKCNNSLKAVELRDSEKEPMLQINDLMMGAICAQKNRRFEEKGAGQYKANLAGYILGKCNLTDYDSDTPQSRDNFSIWNFKSEHLRGGA